MNFKPIVPSDSPIMKMSREGNIAGISRLLQERSASPNDRDPYGRTPIL